MQGLKTRQHLKCYKTNNLLSHLLLNTDIKFELSLTEAKTPMLLLEKVIFYYLSTVSSRNFFRWIKHSAICLDFSVTIAKLVSF